jgi:enamine deaminase RidA (YjgF/YER057c/UK114 family)
MSVEQKLKDKGIELPQAAKPLANYVTLTRAGNLLFLAGHLPTKEGKLQYLGKLGKDLSVEDGYQAAQLCAINCLATIKSEVGDLDKVKKVLKVVGFVNSADGFIDQPKVVNGCSDLLAEVFGEAGRHARSAVGAPELPANAAVEIEMIVEV